MLSKLEVSVSTVEEHLRATRPGPATVAAVTRPSSLQRHCRALPLARGSDAGGGGGGEFTYASLASRAAVKSAAASMYLKGCHAVSTPDLARLLGPELFQVIACQTTVVQIPAPAGKHKTWKCSKLITDRFDLRSK